MKLNNKLLLTLCRFLSEFLPQIVSWLEVAQVIQLHTEVAYGKFDSTPFMVMAFPRQVLLQTPFGSIFMNGKDFFIQVLVKLALPYVFIQITCEYIL